MRKRIDLAFLVPPPGLSVDVRGSHAGSPREG